MFEIIIAIIGAAGLVLAEIIPIVLQSVSPKKTKENMKKALLPCFKDTISDSEVSREVEQIYDQILHLNQAAAHTSVYLRKYEASIEITILEDCVHIKSSYTLCFVNPYHIEYTFKRKPMLRSGLQYSTYSWGDIIYQGQPCSEYIHNYPSSQLQTPNNNYQFKNGLEVPLNKDCLESVLHYSTEYKSEATHFFNTFRFWNYCKAFNIDVRLNGAHADEYEIQWEVFLSSYLQNNHLTRSINCNEPHHITLCDCGWVMPSNGYIISINRIK